MSHSKRTQQDRLPKSLSGYTLFECCLVCGVLIIVQSLAFTAYTNHINGNRVTQVESELRIIQTLIDEYQQRTGDLPEKLVDVGINLTDPWGNPYVYLNISKDVESASLRKDKNLMPINSDYDLYSSGVNGESGALFTVKVSRDDIVRARNGMYIGLANQYGY